MTSPSDLHALISQLRAEEQHRFDNDARIERQHHLRWNDALTDLLHGSGGIEADTASLYRQSWERQRKGSQYEPTYRRGLVHVAARRWGLRPEQAREDIESRCGVIQYQGGTHEERGHDAESPR